MSPWFDARKSKEQFLADLKGFFGDVTGVESTVDQLLQQWHRRKAIIPLPGPREAAYLWWLANQSPYLSEAEKIAFLDSIEAFTRIPATASTWFVVDTILTMRLNDLDEVRYANGDHNEGEQLDEAMEADRLRERDFIRHLAALKRAQVDMLDETGRTTLREKNGQAKAFKAAVNHRFLDDKDRKGRKRERAEKEQIVTAWLNSGPQPWTRDDIVWRKADKLQRYKDVFVTAVSQSELIAAEWKGHPIIPPTDAGEPARFGRYDADKRWYTPKPYIPWPPLHSRPVAGPNVFEPTTATPARRAPRNDDDLDEEWNVKPTAAERQTGNYSTVNAPVQID
jgi:hypothetical protein